MLTGNPLQTEIEMSESNYKPTPELIASAQKARANLSEKRLALNKTLRVQPWEKKLTRTLAIRLKCTDCVGGPTCDKDILTTNPLTWHKNINEVFRAEIRDCEDTRCPLHSFRPFQKKTAPVQDEGPIELK